MSRLLCKFKKNVNQLRAGIPAVQIAEFKPEITIGASYSSIPLMSLVCGESYIEKLEKDYKSHHMLYSLIPSETRGKVINLPFIGETIFYSCSEKDSIRMKDAYINMIKIAYLCGVENIHVSDSNKGGVQFENEYEAINFVRSKKFCPDISSIHAFASCPIGKDKYSGTVNSYGKAFNSDNLYLADSSVLPSSTCLNPQGTVMAIAKMISRNFKKNYAR